MIFRTFSARFDYFLLTRGDALRYAQRLPLAIIFRAFGAERSASSWLLYFAPLALSEAHRLGYHISRLWRWADYKP